MYFYDLCVLALVSFRYSWDVGSVKVIMSVVKAISILLFGRCLSPLCSLACIAFAFSMYMSVCLSDVVYFSRIGIQTDTPPSHRGPIILVTRLSI